MIQPCDIKLETINFFKGCSIEIFIASFLQINAYANYYYMNGELKTVGEVFNIISLVYFTVGMTIFCLGSVYTLWNCHPDDKLDEQKHKRN